MLLINLSLVLILAGAIIFTHYITRDKDDKNDKATGHVHRHRKHI